MSTQHNAPFTVIPSRTSHEQDVPVVFDSPHSGTDYPADFDTIVSRLTLRRAEDTHVGHDVMPDGLFLARVHESACRYFRVAIGPAYNAAHRDHFHYDRGPYTACR